MSKKPAPTRAIIYTRVSKDSLRTGRSVAEQEAECRAVCEREGWPVGEVLQDNDAGASRWSGKDRPAYRRLAEVLRPGDVLVTWEASRAQRDLTAYAELRDLCAALGVLWNYKGRTHDLNVGADRFTTGLDALLAEREADEIRDRVLRSLRANAAEGKPHGKIPYGYQAVRDPQSGLIVAREIDPEAAEILREMATRVLGGESLRSILRDMNPRAGKNWTSATISKMLRQPVLAGYRVYRAGTDDETTVRGTWEPILTDDEHVRLKAVLSDPARRSSPRGTDPVYLLSGIALCGVCGARCYARKSHGKPTYICSADGTPDAPGHHVARNVERVDTLVISKMHELIAEKQTEIFLFHDEKKIETGESAKYLAQAQELQQRLDGFTDAAMRGEMNQKQYMRMEAGLTKEIEKANKLAEEYAVVSDPMLAAMAKSPETIWEDADLELQRRLVRALVDVRILRSKPGHFDDKAVSVKWKGRG